MRALLALMCLLPFCAQADDAELYEPSPPPDSAFVRVIDGVAASVADYRVLPSGVQNFAAGGAKQELNFSAGKFYSVTVPAKGRLELREDAPLANPARARVYFYNLSDVKEAAVVSPDHKNAAIVQKVVPGAAASREVNALTLDLQVQAEGSPVKTFSGVPLKRRMGTTLLLTGSKGNYQAVLKQNAIAR